MCLFIVTKRKKEKEQEIQKKRNIKSRKIDKRKRKMLVSEAFHNTNQISGIMDISKLSTTIFAIITTSLFFILL